MSLELTIFTLFHLFRYAQAKRLGALKDAFASKFGKQAAAWPEELVWIVTDKEPLATPPAPSTYAAVESAPGPEDAAFIQYTSGSTSAPKGVTLTHGNLAHNLSIITNELAASPDTTVVSWLPQYHDMGLIGSLIGVLYCGGSGYYMSPIAFLQRTMGWLEAVSKYRGTHLQAPNFAFGLTARKFDPADYYCGLAGAAKKDEKRVKPLDLSCVKHIINGAEPVTEKSVGAFIEAFTPFGLPKGVIYPTYGLAEHTVFVCSGGRGKIAVRKKELEEDRKVVVVAENEVVAKEDVVQFLGCGFPKNQNVDMRIADPVSRAALPEDRVGEIWVDSPSKARGYYGRDAEETQADFHATLDGQEATRDGYLRTGDLGFLHGEQLYVCGRIKDLLIVNGRNLYPQDIEATAEDVVSEYVRAGCSAAFAVGAASDKEGGETVVLAMEFKEPLPSTAAARRDVAATVRAEISKEHSLPLACVVLVRPRTMPKTTSGKIQRAKARQAYTAGTLEEVCCEEFATGDGAAGAACVKPSGEAANAEAVGDGDGEPSVPALRAAPKKLTPAELRALDRPAILDMLLDTIADLASVDKATISRTAPLATCMDSVTVAQLKGVLEGRFAVKPMSDAYLFLESTTVTKLVEVAKAGVAGDDTGEGASAAAAPVGGGGGPLCCGCAIM